MTEQHDRRLIEDSLPLEAISYQSAREKSIRHGHISTLHIWWARRPLAAMRAAIFAALMPAPKDEEERVQMHRLIGGTYNAESGKWEGGICDWDSVKNGNDATIQQAQALIRKHYPDAPPKVLDPFMGGGSTGLEALRLGAEAHGVELNPVAHIIELCTLVYPQKYGQKITREEYEARPGTLPPVEHMAAYVDDDYDEDEDGDPEQQSFDFDTDEMVNPLAEDVKRWAYWIREQAYQEIGHLYKETTDNTTVGYMWARTAKCPNPTCGSEMPMVRQWWLSKTKGREKAIKPISEVGKQKVEFEVIEGDQIDFNPSDGTIQRGGIRCPVCGQSSKPSYLRAEGQAQRLGALPMVVIRHDPEKSGKTFRIFDESDMNKWLQAQAAYDQLIDDNPASFPDELIPEERKTGNSGFRILLYGMKHWGDVFNKRQLVAMNVLSKKVQEVYEELLERTGEHEYAKVIATYMAVIVNRVASYNTTLCRWQPNGEFIVSVFGSQAIPMLWDYVELNPFSGASGDITSAIDWVTRVVEHATEANGLASILVQGDASRLNQATGIIDAVITDPPYYDAIAYSDLSDFFYVWLKRSIADMYEGIFSTPTTPKSLEIIQEPARHEDSDAAKAFYERKMTQVFSESQRVLRKQGIFVVVFAHKSTAAWETLVNSLLQAGLVTTASWPLHTERPGRLTSLDAASLASSIFIVCRKRVAETDGIYDDVRPLIKARIKERLDYFWKQGIRGADFFISAIGPAVEVFGQYKTVRKLSGDVVTVAELLDIVQQEVADYALSQVMNGGAAFGPFDAATRFYIMYRWSYGKNKIEFDDGMRLAMALGAEVDALMHASSVLKKSGSSVTLLGPYDREKNEKLGEPARDRMAAPLIDMVHRSALLWRAGKREELARYVSTHVGNRVEALRAVAQALVNVLPDGDKEKQLYEGFLQGELPTAPTSTYMFDDDEFNQ